MCGSGLVMVVTRQLQYRGKVAMATESFISSAAATQVGCCQSCHFPPLYVPPHIHPACSLPSCLLRLLHLQPVPFLACSRAFHLPPLDDKCFLIHFKLLQLIILISCLFLACLWVLNMFHLLISHKSLSLINSWYLSFLRKAFFFPCNFVVSVSLSD